MYTLQILPTAEKDMENIIYYISHKLRNKLAAIKLSECFINGAKSILDFPYGAPAYSFVNLKYEYRSINIKNFLMFYTIDEDKKVITIMRVLYNKMDINHILE